jgi:hypothetical protein
MDDQPVATFATADGYLRSSRSLAGPLRTGTHPGVGPKGRVTGPGNSSDFGLDRITPRDFDPMGTCRDRSGVIASELLSRQIRKT